MINHYILQTVPRRIPHPLRPATPCGNKLYAICKFSSNYVCIEYESSHSIQSLTISLHILANAIILLHSTLLDSQLLKPFPLKMDAGGTFIFDAKAATFHDLKGF